MAATAWTENKIRSVATIPLASDCCRECDSYRPNQLVSDSPNKPAILVPSGLPRPVQASQPGQAAKLPLLPPVMSLSADGAA